MGDEKHPTDLSQDKRSCRLPYPGNENRLLEDLHLWMTTQEAAEYSGYDVQYVRRLARQGKIGTVKKAASSTWLAGLRRTRGNDSDS